MYNSLHDSINKGKDSAKKSLVMARVSNCPCPANLDKKPSRLHTHPSNGVFIAVDNDVIYCSCSECRFEEDREGKGGNLKLVKGTEGLRYSWARITEEEYKTLVKAACVTGEPPSVPAVCVCVCLNR